MLVKELLLEKTKIVQHGLNISLNVFNADVLLWPITNSSDNGIKASIFLMAGKLAFWSWDGDLSEREIDYCGAAYTGFTQVDTFYCLFLLVFFNNNFKTKRKRNFLSKAPNCIPAFRRYFQTHYNVFSESKLESQMSQSPYSLTAFCHLYYSINYI